MADVDVRVATGAKVFGAIANNRGVVVGDALNSHIVGSQTNNHYYPARPETPPVPSCAVPFCRDRDFVDRGTLLDQIRQNCDVPASRTALVGLGGVGKSQLAIEHCYRIANHFPETWVFWVHASDAARIEQGYQDIADQVRLAGRDDPQADVFKLVHNWLRNEKNGKWLLVLDNVDDAAALTLAGSNDPVAQVSSRNGFRSRFLSAYLPRSKNGSVLMTSRTRSVATQLVEEDDIVSIEPMDEASGPELLRKKLGEEVDKDGIAELASALEFMPLALVQAAAFIRQHASRCSVRQYLEEFHKSDRKKTGLLDYNGGHLRRDEEAKNSILITWQISFDHIFRVRRSAADLLSLMSFFDRQGIPEALLRDRHGTENRPRHRDVEDGSAKNTDSDSDDSGSEACVDNAFEKDVLTLRNYFFIGITTDATTFNMHRLVQLAMRKWLEEQGQLETWKQQYIANLCAAFPIAEHENWSQCQALFPHAKSALSQMPQSAEFLQKWALLLYSAAWYACEKGNVSDAEKLARKSMKVRKRLLGSEHVDTLSSITMAGHATILAGRWKEAEELDIQVMETRKRVLGEEHPFTLASIANLASTYRCQGRWEEAEKLQKKELEVCLRVFGEEHPDTLTSIANLASTYSDQGRWKEAEQLDVQVIEMRKRVLREEHLDMLTSIANLASTYRNQGRWKQAEELEMQVIETRKRVLGEEHPDTLSSLGNLATTYSNQGRWKEAEELDIQVMETRKRVLGEKHPDTLTSIANLAATYSDQGRWKEAEELNVQVIDTRKRVLGEKHPDTLTSIANLASTYSGQGRWNEAEKLELQLIEIRKRVLGKEHPNTLSSIANLARTYSYQDRWKEAEELHVQVIETSKRVLGEEHPDTLTSMGNLALTYSNQGRWKKAEELEVQVIEVSMRVLGEEHPDTLTSMGNLALTYRSQGRWKEALKLDTQVMDTSVKVLGLEHPNTATSMSNLAFTVKSRSLDEDALFLIRTCFQLRKRIFGDEHSETKSALSTLNNWQVGNIDLDL